jgi:lipoprotein-releasing system ATP-binding protein
MREILKLNKVTKAFQTGEETISVLREVDFSLGYGEGVSLVGPSGSGKSTLLQVIALLMRPTTGSVVVMSIDATNATEAERSTLRRKNIGFVYQFHHLLPEFSALENVIIPQLVNGIHPKKAREISEELLSAVGLSHRLHSLPAKLSGGEQQRVAIARALANDPCLVIADEPTGSLDKQTAEKVLSMFDLLLRERNVAAIVATHDLGIAERFGKVMKLENGTIC